MYKVHFRDFKGRQLLLLTVCFSTHQAPSDNGTIEQTNKQKKKKKKKKKKNAPNWSKFFRVRVDTFLNGRQIILF